MIRSDRTPLSIWQAALPALLITSLVMPAAAQDPLPGGTWQEDIKPKRYWVYEPSNFAETTRDLAVDGHFCTSPKFVAATGTLTLTCYPIGTDYDRSDTFLNERNGPELEDVYPEYEENVWETSVSGSCGAPTDGSGPPTFSYTKNVELGTYEDTNWYFFFVALDTEYVAKGDFSNPGTLDCTCERPGCEPEPQPPLPDSDNDGVTDDADQCAGTAVGEKTDDLGCPVTAQDTDNDGVADVDDACPGRGADGPVTATGCPLDLDGDGVDDDNSPEACALNAKYFKSAKGDATNTVSCLPNSCMRQINGCQAAVMVVPGAEDAAGELTPEGQQHAALYADMFSDFVYNTGTHAFGDAEMCACEIGTVLAIDPTANASNQYPSSVPADTVQPFADAYGPQLQAGVITQDSSGVSLNSGYEWCANRRKALASLMGINSSKPYGTHSVLVAWDKPGLNSKNYVTIQTAEGSYTIAARDPNVIQNPAPYEDILYSVCEESSESDWYQPLLLALPKSFPLENASVRYHPPAKTEMFLFANPDVNGDFKFGTFRYYQQVFSDDGETWRPWSEVYDTGKYGAFD